MHKRRLGRTDLLVSQICLGSMTWGQQNTEAEGHAQMDLAFERGVNFIDTAELYPIPPKAETQGRTEKIIGSWMKANGNRDKVIIASKVVGRTGNTWFRGDRPSKLARADIFDAVEKSLTKLGTDYIDLYQIHWPERDIPWGANPTRVGAVARRADTEGAPSGETPIAETLGVFDELVKAGKIRHFGLSNESSWGVMRYLAEADRGIGPRPVSLQNAYNLVNRTFEVNLAEVCQREEIAFLPYSPLAQGYLTGKYDHGARPQGSRSQLFNRGQRYETPNAAQVLLEYNTLARSFGMEPAMFANAYVSSRPFVTSNIIGATAIWQLEMALSSVEVRWTEEMQKAVDAVHQRVGNPCP
ncbi:aldo/keto reductase [Mesorhizobium sp. M4A.F.Ca.ET.020.02.1.1]|uniref:aldo/keto reductase n=1 Tax=unclassified Mesorhizobium TaxID=325217 RepID=UPI000FCADD7B|nr:MULTISPECIES: aldo/keto reductase [unclassified Mesorhizobium]RVD70728.1 aldo/keto reductase [Mesorhizobium sp. M4A.F.Ca.ET.029.04.2.1]RUX44509.1 aldo/keto reductase [Mesorhizobium sp. M4A.F.Ca.ET.050.02.1.1]RVC77845.1 aldo/keto reductase [Mesorhizobium sp. M4A.F.Ca.ET.022.05.2.1]RVD36436.1 aldo/keto reductase [Mesorhizobium sp. M4A.F.Ca.ET.020.02.1.1]RWC19372.1 MAG: aldo/keto reductase [Mesorhizobium sp.]